MQLDDKSQVKCMHSDAALKTIVHVYGNYPKKIGSIEESYFELTRQLNDNGFRTIFVFTGEIDDKLRPHYDTLGAQIVIIRAAVKRLDTQLIGKFIRLYRTCRPTIVNTFFGYTSFNALLAARLCGVHNTVWTRGSFIENGPFYRRLPAWKTYCSVMHVAGCLAKRIIADSEGLKEEMRRYHLPAEKIRHIYRGINLSRFQHVQPPVSLSSELGIQPEDRVVSCISQARPEKGLEYLISAVPAIIARIPRLKLLLVGGGPLTADLQRLAAELGVADHLVFCGVRHDVEHIIALSECTVLPSLTEGLGLVTQESLAGGRPVVATSVGGIPEVVIDGHCGFLVPPRNADALAEKLIALLSQPELLKRLGANGSERARLFDVRDGAAQTVALYNEMLGF